MMYKLVIIFIACLGLLAIGCDQSSAKTENNTTKLNKINENSSEGSQKGQTQNAQFCKSSQDSACKDKDKCKEKDKCKDKDKCNNGSCKQASLNDKTKEAFAVKIEYCNA